MTTHSAEIRWFFKGPASQEIQDWFLSGQKLDLEERSDHYLILPECDSTGVKMRGGKPSDESFEIKAQVSAPHPLRLENGINGRADQWVRWSFKHAGFGALKDDKTGKDVIHTEQWVTVKKERYLRKFSADGEELVEVDIKEKPNRGCGVELTRITVAAREKEWFSLSFEAFEKPSEVSYILGDTLRLFFQKYGQPPGIELSGRNSLSYPSWLATLTEPFLILSTEGEEIQQ